MSDITSPRLIIAKGFLFLAVGLLAAGLILFEHPSLRIAALLAISVWAFARFYYFMFYVIEHYVDSQFKFSGLWSFVAYIYSRRKGVRPQ